MFRSLLGSNVHDPGPQGDSGEGVAGMTMICITYLATTGILVYEKFFKPKKIQEFKESDFIDEEKNEDITEEVMDKNTQDQWLVPNNDYSTLVKGCLCLGVLYSVWAFLLILSVMGTGFKLLGGKDSAKMFDVADNPISGLMIGILATVLVQSSSTTTSIIVSLVGANELSVRNAVFMIMGANIGTSVTNTIISMGHMYNKNELRRGFSAATIHDIFNLLSVLIFLPINWAYPVFEKLTYEMVKDKNACEGDCEKQEFLKPYVSPYSKGIASYDKKVAKYVSQGNCDDGRCDKPLLKDGLLYDWGMSDENAGIVLTVSSLLALCCGIFNIVYALQIIVKGPAARILKRVVGFNGYANILIGMIITILVQSSSITTSTLTPIAAVGLISLEDMMPLTLGANIGTTLTGVMAATVVTSNPVQAWQVALCHLLFNVCGILVWYPIPKMRQIPLSISKKLGQITNNSKYGKVFPLIYTSTVFLIIPGVAYGISYAVQ